jgi:hypothetical protein
VVKGLSARPWGVSCTDVVVNILGVSCELAVHNAVRTVVARTGPRIAVDTPRPVAVRTRTPRPQMTTTTEGLAGSSGASGMRRTICAKP